MSSVVVLAGCPSGVSDDPFGLPTGATQQTTTAATITTGNDDNDSQITADAVGTVDTGASDDPTTGTGAGATTTGVDPDSSSGGGADCNPPCQADEICIAGNCLPDNMGGSSSGGMVGCNQVAGNYDTCLGVGDVVNTQGCGAAAVTCLTGGMPVAGGVCSVT